MKTEPKKSRTELLQEALLLEQMGGEWEPEHAAAFCSLSVSLWHRSTCPRIHKQTVRGVAGRAMVRCIPKDVRVWNQSRTLQSA